MTSNLANLTTTTFPSLVRGRMGNPGKIFIHNDDGRDVTFEDLWTLSGRLAGALVAAGARSGDRVAMQVDKSPEAIALFLACARAGLILVPLNPAYTLPELAYFIADAAPRVIIATPQRAAALRSLGEVHGVGATLSLGTAADGDVMEAAFGQASDFSDVPGNWDDIIAILYTSGTTGRSKGAMLSHGNLASNALTLVDAWRFTPEDTLIHALPIYHTHGLFTATNTLLLAGGAMLFRARFDAGDILGLMSQATAMMGVPTFYTRLLQHPGLTRDAVASIRLFISGSAPLLAETHAAFASRTGHVILERYGMTETNMNTSNPYVGERIAGTVGPPLPGIEVRVSDPATGTAIAAGEIGMIEVRGRNVFKGYWRMPDRTAAEFRADGFFITGDLGCIDEKGYVSILGRGKDLIITGGLNVYPKEVETEIDLITGVVESAVIGLAHPDFGEAVTAAVVCAAAATLTENEVLRHLECRLAKFKLPKRVIFVEELPRNAMGKVQKNVLRERFAELYA